MLTTVTDLIYGALTEIRVARGGDVVRAEDQALCLNLLNEVIERLPVTPNALYARGGASVTLVPGLGTFHTIGPTGTCVVPRRPVRLTRATLVMPPATASDVPIMSAAWYSGQTLPLLTAPIPQGLYYNPAWPNGALAFWPQPSMPYPVALEFDLEITAVADTDSLDLPQGYSELLRLWTAKKAAPSFAREFSAASQAALTECLADVFGSNIGRVNDADTRDGGVPGGRGGIYDYRTGQVT
jgi:hypothetical protein